MNMGGFDRDAGPVRGTNYPLYSDALLNWYQTKNVKSVRFMFTWEAVQSAVVGPVPATEPGYANYWSDLTSVLTRLLARRYLRDFFPLAIQHCFRRHRHRLRKHGVRKHGVRPCLLPSSPIVFRHVQTA
jgi:hypothetical protein